MEGNGESNQAAPYKKLTTKLGYYALLVQGHIYTPYSLGQNYYSCSLCNKNSPSFIYFENDVIIEAKSCFKHSENHGRLSEILVKIYWWDHVKIGYFKNSENHKKAADVICDEILENHTLDSLGFKDRAKFVKNIDVYLMEQKNRKRLHHEAFGPPEKSQENLAQKNSNVPPLENSSGPPKNLSEKAIKKLKFCVSEINDLLSSDVFSVKNVADAKFYVSEINELLSDKDSSIKFIYKMKSYVLEIDDLMDSDVFSVKIVEKIKFYVSKIGDLMGSDFLKGNQGTNV